MNGDSKKVESWSFAMEIVSRTPGYGRIEISGAMGVYGGTIVWTPEETRILLPGRRMFVVAPNSNRAFASILPFELSPAELEAVFFDRDFDSHALAGRGMKCESTPAAEEGASAEMCRGRKNLVLERVRGNADTSLNATTETSSVKFQLRPVRAKVQERAELWKLEAPSGFKLVDQRSDQRRER